MVAHRFVVITALVVLGCGAPSTTEDAGGIAGGAASAGGTASAGGSATAGGSAGADAGSGDAGILIDAGVADAGFTPTNNFWTFATPWETRVRNTAEIARVFVPTQSFVVVYADNNGTRGAQRFATRVSQLSPNRILLDLDPNSNNGLYWAPNQILHLAVYEDLGVRGTYEPGIDPLLIDNMGQPMTTMRNLRFISSTTVESSQYYHRNCTTSQYEQNRTNLPSTVVAMKLSRAACRSAGPPATPTLAATRGALAPGQRT